MTITGIVDKIQRAINQQLKKIRKKFSRPGKKKKAEAADNEIEIPRKWLRQPRGAVGKKKPLVMEDDGKRVIIKTRKAIHVSWLLNFKRGVAAILLLVNFAISQFLLASGTDASPAFIFFLANCFIFLDYLWKTRRKEG